MDEEVVRENPEAASMEVLSSDDTSVEVPSYVNQQL